jgi:4-deoxy-L-threo-5-hexosulose-uronate ketol-isomerase
MKVLHSIHQDDFKQYDTTRIRQQFLLDDIMQGDAISLIYTHYDRMIVGGAVPLQNSLQLGSYENLKADYFLERREMGIINVGGEAIITTNEQEHRLEKLDCLYIGKGTRKVSFASADVQQPAVLYILSAPAHADYPVTLLKKEAAESNELGSLETSNSRTIHRYIHKNGIKSCQLVMGLTLLKPGSVWNTIPPHTHDRRMEAYFYFDVPDGQVVFHYMGQPGETRHIVIKNLQAVVSPPWSIHAGSGTSNYGFIWGMAGENLEYGDMDGVGVGDLK